MLLLDIYRVCEDKGIENPHRFLRENGFTAQTTRWLLTKNVQDVSFIHIEQICLLLNCTIDDLFNWKSNDSSGKYKNHVLNKLKRQEKQHNIIGKLEQLPPDKMEAIRNYIDQLASEDRSY